MNDEEVSQFDDQSNSKARPTPTLATNLSANSRSGTQQHLAENNHILSTGDSYLESLARPSASSERNLSQCTNSVDGAFYSKSESATPVARFHVDAVHPFFTNYKNIKHDKSTSTDNQTFYCRQCNVQIDLSQEAVNEHFASLSHVPIEELCVYCQTPVYEYFYNENRYYYHRCPREQPKGKEMDDNTSKENSSNSSSHVLNSSTK